MSEMALVIRRYSPSDIRAVIDIFESAIRGSCLGDYDQVQIDAWLSSADANRWNAIFMEHYSLLALFDGEPAGFGDISEEGHLNLLYVRPEYQGKGIASALCERLEKHVGGLITVEASLTARPFFLHRGYREIAQQKVYRKGIALTNFRMEKQTDPKIN